MTGVSVEIMTRVWLHSRHKGAPLLLLLALADHANDDGVCWPSIATLSKKIRVKTTRAVQLLLRQLRESGEVLIEGIGPGGTHLYRVNISSGANVSSGVKPSSGVNVSSPEEDFAPPLKVSSGPPEEERQETPKVSSYKPSGTINEPSGNRQGARAGARASTPPEEFKISESMRQWATEEGFSEAEVARETAKMLDHFRGNGGMKKDWIATWRNWLRNSRDRFGGKNGAHQQNRGSPAGRGSKFGDRDRSADGRVQWTPRKT